MPGVRGSADGHKIGGEPKHAGVCLSGISSPRLSPAPSNHLTIHTHAGPWALLTSELVRLVRKVARPRAGAHGTCLNARTASAGRL